MKPKPQPPADLWAVLGSELDAIRARPKPKPEGAFTRAEFQEKFCLSDGQAYDRLGKLIAAGKVKKAGTTGANTYYVLIANDNSLD